MRICQVTVEAGSSQRPPCVVRAALDVHESLRPAAVEVCRDGVPVLSEYEQNAETGAMQIAFAVDALALGETRAFEVRLHDAGEEPQATREARVRLEEEPDHIRIVIDGELFTRYYFGADLARPYCYPLNAKGGLCVTRSWPMDDSVRDEVKDHPHHRGLWVAHGDVNGVDNWSEEKGHGHTRHEEFHSVRSGTLFGHLAARGTWIGAGGEQLLEETRHVVVHELSDGIRVLDLDVHLRALKPVTFGDTKEGGICSVRVATSMTGDRGGKIENADGATGEKSTWGRRSDWCDYSGTVKDQRLGVAILDHPESFRHPTYWHVRDYGLMTANPFGVSVFTGDREQNGSHALAEGETLLFRYRVLVHPGDAHDADIAGHYVNWTDPPRTAVRLE